MAGCAMFRVRFELFDFNITIIYYYKVVDVYAKKCDVTWDIIL